MRSLQHRGYGSVPPGYARGHGPRGFGRLNVPLGYARGHGPRGFGRVNVSPGCVETSRAEIWRCECSAGPGVRDRGRGGFTLLCAPGRAWMQGPGRFGHVNVVGAGGLGGPAGRVQSVTAMADSSRRMVGMRTLTRVSSGVRRSGSGTRHNGHRAGVLGYVRASAGRRADSDR